MRGSGYTCSHRFSVFKGVVSVYSFVQQCRATRRCIRKGSSLKWGRCVGALCGSAAGPQCKNKFIASYLDKKFIASYLDKNSSGIEHPVGAIPGCAGSQSAADDTGHSRDPT